MIALDIETAPVEGFPQPYALQPWRAREGKATITAVAVARSDGSARLETDREGYAGILQSLRGKPVVTWNGVFDIAWLIASGFGPEVESIRWLDGMLLWKWYANSQRMETAGGWSLDEASEVWCSDEPWMESFRRMKAAAPDAVAGSAYWERRAKMDAFVTAVIADRVWDRLDDRRRNSAKIEAECLVPVARSWVRGIRVDVEAAKRMKGPLEKEMAELESKLGVNRTVLASPKQLGILLYEEWGMPVEYVSETTGAPATHKAALTYLSDKDDRVLDILRWRKLNTQLTKFVGGVIKAAEYCGSDVVHPQPRLFSTYTGRMTYSSKSGRKGEAAKAYIGVAIHQWPRDKVYRKLILPPKRFILGELDAAGQEARIMAEKSQDSNMLHVFRQAPPNDDLHSFTGAQIAGLSFQDFLRAYREGNEAVAGPFGYRYLGKITNLSNQYRIGPKKARIVARVDYGVTKDVATIRQWQDAYRRLYPGVTRYWDRQIQIAKQYKYVETFAGRRFGISYWHEDMRWSSESSAINMPIQGAGADQKELAIAILRRTMPELEFGIDLHDGLYFYIPAGLDAKSVMRRAKQQLDNLPYLKAWGWAPSIPLPWDAAYGENWGSMEEVT